MASIISKDKASPASQKSRRKLESLSSSMPSDMPSMIPSDEPSLVPSDVPSLAPSIFWEDYRNSKRPSLDLSRLPTSINGVKAGGSVEGPGSSLLLAFVLALICLSISIIACTATWMIRSRARTRRTLGYQKDSSRKRQMYQRDDDDRSSYCSGSFVSPAHFGPRVDESSQQIHDVDTCSSLSKDDGGIYTRNDVNDLPTDNPETFVANWMELAETPADYQNRPSLKARKSVSFRLPESYSEDSSSRDDTSNDIPSAPNLWEIGSVDSSLCESRSYSGRKGGDSRGSVNDSRDQPERSGSSATHNSEEDVNPLTVKGSWSGESISILSPLEDLVNEKYAEKIRQWKKRGKV